MNGGSPSGLAEPPNKKTTTQLKVTRWWFQIFVYVHPYLGKIPILTNIFQMGGSTTNQKVKFAVVPSGFQYTRLGELTYPAWGIGKSST